MNVLAARMRLAVGRKLIGGVTFVSQEEGHHEPGFARGPCFSRIRSISLLGLKASS